MSRADPRLAKRRQTAVGVPLAKSGSRLRTLGVSVLCLKLALVPLAFDPSADIPFVLPRTLLSHGLTYILLGVLLALFAVKGPSFLVRSWVHVPVLVFFGISLVATVVAANPTLALFGTHARMLGLATIADGVVTYFAVVYLIRQRRDAVAIVVCVLAASLVILAYEAIQLLGRDPFSWNVDVTQRPFSTLGQPTTLGQYLSVLSVGALTLAVLTRSLPKSIRGILIAYAALLLVGAVLTGTRAAALGLAAAVVLFVVLIWAKHPNKKARLLSVIGGAAAVVVLAGLLLVTPLGARLISTLEPSNASGTEDAAIGQLEPSIAVRFAIYEIAAHMVSERPLTGYGPDNFAAALPEFRPERAPQPIRQSIATSSHSWIAAVATSTGLLGLTAFLIVIGAAAFALFRSDYNSLAVAAALVVGAYLASGAVSINAIETDTLFWLGIAAIVSATASGPTVPDHVTTRPQRSRRQPSSSLVPMWIAWALVAVAIVITATTLPALEASRLAKRSASLRTPATAGLAIDVAGQATRVDPNRAEYWQELALANVAGAHWTDASIAFQKAAKLAPYDIRFLTDDIQVQLAMAHGGDSKALERAGRLADQAVHVDPNNPNGHLNRAVVAFDRGDLPAAVESIDRALLLDPNSTNSQLFAAAAQIYVAATQSAVAAGRLDDAIAKGRNGVAQLGSNAASVPIRLELARALVQSGRPREALDVIDAALALAPTDQSLLQLKQEILRAQ
jgi:O-antigen ligase/tetratricopeptide (TPR) repeat protein